MQPDAKQIVEEGYDRIAHLHAEWAARVRSEERARYLAAFCARVPAGVSVLELGCGAGGAVTDALAAHYRLTAIDLSRIAGWLEVGGLFMAAFGTADEARSYEDNWLGVPMVWSSHDTATTCSMVRAAGFEIESAVVESADEDGQAVALLWIVACKSGA